MLEEYKYMTEYLQLTVIGFCRDASGDERAARLKVMISLPSLLFADCWAHQESCLSVKYIEVYLFFMTTFSGSTYGRRLSQSK